MEEATATSQDEEDVKRKMNLEIDHYFNEKIVPMSTNICTWWKDTAFIYPNMAQLAKKYLNIPATQASSERLFSLAGNILTDDRGLLLDEHVEEIAFLHENLK